MENYYDILGVSKNASADEIKKAYRKSAVKFHPDKQQGKSESERKEAENQFKKIQEAYDCLSDENKKSNYDRFGTAEGPGPGMGGFPGGFGFGDDIFNMFSGRRGSTREFVEPGETIQVDIPISIEELYTGVTKDIEFTVNVRCEHCHGEGGTGITQCPHCHGSGMITEIRQQGFMTMQSSHPCPHCHGTGKIVKETCKNCNGTGFKRKLRKVKIELPKGVTDNATRRYEGQGSESKNIKGPNGDVIVVTRYTFDRNKYRVVNNDVYELIEVPYYDCIIGTTYKVKIPSGKTIDCIIPAYAKDGTQIKVKGEGINGYNYIFIVQVKMPTYVKESEKELLKKIHNLNN